MVPMILPFVVLFPIAAALLVLPLRGKPEKYLDWLILLVPGVELACALLLLSGSVSFSIPHVCGLGLGFASGSLRSLMVMITAFLWMMTALTCREYFAGTKHRERFYAFYLITLGATMGVFLASDLYTLLIFFEIMSFASYVWVVQEETPQAIRAGRTYLAVAVLGGMALLVGLFILYHLMGTLQIEDLFELAKALPARQRPELMAGGVFCLIGFGAKAGIFPLHIWLTKAYPAAPAPGSALLSGVLSKTGFFGLLIITCNLFFHDSDWNMLLLTLALITMMLGAVLALFSVNLKRTLACSSMSQYGFILLGIAMQGFMKGENALAAWGTTLHMLNHSLIKLVLFVAAGVIFLGASSLDLNDIRGWGRNKPWLMVPFFVGAMSISGIPLSSGYVSKTLLHESIVEYIHLLAEEGMSVTFFHWVEWAFLITGGLTIAYMTKIFVAIFVEKPPRRQPASGRDYMSGGTRAALCCGSAVLVILGLTPSLTMEKIGIWAGEFVMADSLEHAFHYFSLTNLKGAAISMLIGALVYQSIVHNALREKQGDKIVYPNRWPKKLDLEEGVYLPLIHGLSFAGAFCARVAASAGVLIVTIGEKLLFLRAPGYFVPKENVNFGVYRKEPRIVLVKEAFSFSLMLSGFGLMVMLLYILF